MVAGAHLTGGQEPARRLQTAIRPGLQPVPLDRAMSLLGLSVARANYRSRWFSALIASGFLEAVVSFGSLADTAWREFEKTAGTAATLPY
jgi:hypothetical protein